MTPILNCQEPDCPKDFYKLESCGESHLKTCIDCFKRIMLVPTKEMAEIMIKDRQKVAVDETTN